MRAPFLSALAPLLLALPASAQEIAVDLDDLGDSVEIVREAEIADILRPVPDRDSVDTAIVFTNKRGSQTAAKCIGLDAKGNVVGRAYTRVAANGLAILFASDLTDDADVIGSARCASRPGVVASAFLLSPGSVTDLPVQQRRSRGAKRILVPVVATY